MAVGGNHRARQFFKEHGWSELGADKIEQKVVCAFHMCLQGLYSHACPQPEAYPDI